MARSRSSNHGAELSYGDEKKNRDILRLSQSFLWKSDFYVENPIFFFCFFFCILYSFFFWGGSTQHTLSRQAPPPPRLSRSGAFIELPALNAPFGDNRGGGGLISKGCARPYSHPIPFPFPQPLHSRQARFCNNHEMPSLILCSICLLNDEQKEGNYPSGNKAWENGLYVVFLLTIESNTLHKLHL